MHSRGFMNPLASEIGEPFEAFTVGPKPFSSLLRGTRSSTTGRISSDFCLKAACLAENRRLKPADHILTERSLVWTRPADSASSARQGLPLISFSSLLWLFGLFYKLSTLRGALRASWPGRERPRSGGWFHRASREPGERGERSWNDHENIENE